MGTLDVASAEAQQTVVSEIFRSAVASGAELTLGSLLQAYDQTTAKHGICASDLAGIQIYRALLRWGREQGIGAKANSVAAPLPCAALRWEPAQSGSQDATRGGQQQWSDAEAVMLSSSEAMAKVLSRPPPPAAPVQRAGEPTTAGTEHGLQRRRPSPVGVSSPCGRSTQLPSSSSLVVPSPPVPLQTGHCASSSSTAPAPVSLPAPVNAPRAPSLSGQLSPRSIGPTHLAHPLPVSLPSWISAPTEPPVGPLGGGPLPPPPRPRSGRSTSPFPKFAEVDYGESSPTARLHSADYGAGRRSSIGLGQQHVGGSPPPHQTGRRHAAHSPPALLPEASAVLDKTALSGFSGSTLPVTPARMHPRTEVGPGGVALAHEASWSTSPRHPVVERASAQGNSLADPQRHGIARPGAGGHLQHDQQMQRQAESPNPSMTVGCVGSHSSPPRQRRSPTPPPRAGEFTRQDGRLYGSCMEPHSLGARTPPRPSELPAPDSGMRSGGQLFDSFAAAAGAPGPCHPLRSTAPQNNSFAPDQNAAPLAGGAFSTEGADDAHNPNFVLAEAFLYRRLLQVALRAWGKGIFQRKRYAAIVDARQRQNLGSAVTAWQTFVEHVSRLRAARAKQVTTWSRGRIQLRLEVVLASWREVHSRQRLLKTHCASVGRLRLRRLMALWQEALQRSAIRQRSLQRVLLKEWRSVVKLRKALRAASSLHTRQSSERQCGRALRFWARIRQQRLSLQEKRASAVHGVRWFRAISALETWYSLASRHRKLASCQAACAVAFAKRRRLEAVVHWRSFARPKAQREALQAWLTRSRRSRCLGEALRSWHRDFAVPRRRYSRGIRRLQSLGAKRALRHMLKCWRRGVQACRAELERIDHRRELRLCTVAFWVLRAYSTERGVLREYKGWSDIHWVQSLARRGWKAWRHWLQEGGGRVAVVSSERQVYASWRWLRLSGSSVRPAGGSSPGPTSSIMQLQTMHRERRQRRPELAPPVLVAAAELLFAGSAIKDVHPHRFQAWSWSIASLLWKALTRRMVLAWRKHVRLFRFSVAKHNAWYSAVAFSAWQQAIARRQKARECERALGARLFAWRRKALLSRWHRRYCSHHTLRQGAQAFATRARQRLCRRAIASWFASRARQSQLLVVARQIIAKCAWRIQREVFQEFVACWQQCRQEELMVRLSGLFLRKNSLRGGLYALRDNVDKQRLQRVSAQMRYQRLQCLWLQRWHRRAQFRLDVRRRDHFAIRWSQSKLQMRVCQAWEQYSTLAALRRNRQFFYSRAHKRQAAKLSVQTWRGFARCRRTQQQKRTLVSKMMQRHALTRSLRHWHSRIAVLSLLRRRNHEISLQLLAFSMHVWRCRVQEASAFDVQCVASIVVLRFRHLLMAWRREVQLAHFVGRFFRDISRRHLQQSLCLFRRRTQRRRWVRAKWAALKLHRRESTLTRNFKGWAQYAQSSSACRRRVEAWNAAYLRLASSVVDKWRQFTLHEKELQVRAKSVAGLLRARLAGRIMKSLWRAAVSALGVRALLAQSRQARARAALSAWRGTAVVRARCHRAFRQVSGDVLPQRRRRAVWAHWRARCDGRNRFRGQLAAFRAASVARRLRQCVVAWLSALARERAIRARLGRFAAMLEAAQRRWALRRLALWYVYCIDRDDALVRAVVATTRGVLRGGLVAWSRGAAWRRRLEAQEDAGLLLRAMRLCRKAFSTWLFLMESERQAVAQQAAASQFRWRSQLANFFLSWRKFAHAARVLHQRTTASRRHLQSQERQGALQSWAAWSRRRREQRRRSRALVSRVRHVGVLRLLHGWRDRLRPIWRTQAIVEAAVTRHTWELRLSVPCRGRFPPRARAVAGVRALAYLLRFRRLLLAWRRLQASSRARRAHVSRLADRARAGLDFAVCTTAFRALSFYVASASSRRKEVTRCCQQRALSRLLTLWSNTARRLAARFAELANVHKCRTASVLKPVLQCWIGHYLMHRTYAVLAREVRELCGQRRARDGLYTWVEATVLAGKGRRAYARKLKALVAVLLRKWRGVLERERLVHRAFERSQRRVLARLLPRWRRVVERRRLGQLAADQKQQRRRRTVLSTWMRAAQKQLTGRAEFARKQRDLLAIVLRSWRNVAWRLRRSRHAFAVKQNELCAEILSDWRHVALRQRKGRQASARKHRRSLASALGQWRHVAEKQQKSSHAFALRQRHYLASLLVDWRVVMERHRRCRRALARKQKRSLTRVLSRWQHVCDCHRRVHAFAASIAGTALRLAFRDWKLAKLHAHVECGLARCVLHLWWKSAMAAKSRHQRVEMLRMRRTSRRGVQAVRHWLWQRNRTRLRRMRLRGAFCRWCDFRFSRIAHAEQLRWVHTFRKRTGGALDRARSAAWQNWAAAAVETRRWRWAGTRGAAVQRRWRLRLTLDAWAAIAGHLARVQAAGQRVEQARRARAAFSSVGRWREQARQAAELRLAAVTFVAFRARRVVLASLNAWCAVVQSLIAAETRMMLQADDFRGQRRRRFLGLVAATWHDEAARAKRSLQKARLAKTFSCWRLLVREQVLLRRYLRECSTAAFSAGSSALPTSTATAQCAAQHRRALVDCAPD